MATYEYVCQMCLEHKLVTRPINDLLARDPYCDFCTIPMSRLYSATPAIFKGNGWAGKS